MTSGIRAIDIMSHKVVTANQNMTIFEAAKLMNKHRIGGLPVCEGEKLIGLLTERDIMMKVIAVDKHPSKITVRQVMNSPLKAHGEKFEDITSLAHKLNEHDISRVPILHDGKLVGMVTNKDILEHAPHLLENFLERERMAAKGRPEHPAAFGICERCALSGHLHYTLDGFMCDDCS